MPQNPAIFLLAGRKRDRLERREVSKTFLLPKVVSLKKKKKNIKTKPSPARRRLTQAQNTPLVLRCTCWELLPPPSSRRNEGFLKPAPLFEETPPPPPPYTSLLKKKKSSLKSLPIFQNYSLMGVSRENMKTSFNL